MKSTTTYEMHNYGSNTAPTVSRGDASTNEAATTATINSACEKYSLRQRQKRRTAAMAAAELINAERNNYLSEDNCNNNSTGKSAIERESPTSAGSHDAITAKIYTNNKSRKRSGTAAASNSNSNSSSHTSVNGTLTSTATPTTKVKTKAAPLSKYRRKTANARERTRMREINSAFENLRQCVPHTITGDETTQSSEKLSKITTLRLAMKYIRVLSEALANPSFEADFLLECKRDGDHRFTTHDWQQQQQQQRLLMTTVGEDEDDEYDDLESKPSNIEPERRDLLPKTRGKAASKASKPAKNVSARTKSAKGATAITTTSDTSAASTRKAPTRRQTKKQKLQQSVSPYNSNSHSSAASTCSSLSTSTSTSAYASLGSANTSPPCSSTSNSSSYLLDSPAANADYLQNLSHSMSDLSHLILESDGESLHLSEPCLSPTNHGIVSASVDSSLPPSATSLLSLAYANKHQPLADILSPFDQHLAAMSSTLENPLELSLRLLDSSAHSLEFSVTSSNAEGATADQHASPSGMSPLGALDTFNSFSDLLHIDFPEHNALDLFFT